MKKSLPIPIVIALVIGVALIAYSAYLILTSQPAEDPYAKIRSEAQSLRAETTTGDGRREPGPFALANKTKLTEAERKTLLREYLMTEVAESKPQRLSRRVTPELKSGAIPYSPDAVAKLRDEAGEIGKRFETEGAVFVATGELTGIDRGEGKPALAVVNTATGEEIVLDAIYATKQEARVLRTVCAPIVEGREASTLCRGKIYFGMRETKDGATENWLIGAELEPIDGKAIDAAIAG